MSKGIGVCSGRTYFNTETCGCGWGRLEVTKQWWIGSVRACWNTLHRSEIDKLVVWTDRIACHIGCPAVWLCAWTVGHTLLVGSVMINIKVTPIQ